jgi:16S rRNA processing protein RimM
MIQRTDITEVGKFLKTHALKGELNVVMEVDADIFDDSDVAIIVDMDGIYVPFYCESIRRKGSMAYLIKIDGVDTETEAKQFVNKEIYISKVDLKKIDENSDHEDDDDGGYADEFIGYTIKDAALGEIGVITDIDISTANPLFIVECSDELIYIPIADEFITLIDSDNHAIEMDLPQGLIELNKKQ